MRENTFTVLYCKNTRINGPVQFTPMLFKGQLYFHPLKLNHIQFSPLHIKWGSLYLFFNNKLHSEFVSQVLDSPVQVH